MPKIVMIASVMSILLFQKLSHRVVAGVPSAPDIGCVVDVLYLVHQPPSTLSVSLLLMSGVFLVVVCQGI